MKPCHPAKGYLPVPGPASLCTSLALLCTCGTVILVTRAWWGYRKTCYLDKGCLPVLGHRQLLPQNGFLESFLDIYHSFRVLVLRPTFTGPVFHEESPGACGFHISSLTAESFTSYCLLQSFSCFPGNIFRSLGLRFRFGLVRLHGLGGESLVSCVSHGPMGGLL